MATLLLIPSVAAAATFKPYRVYAVPSWPNGWPDAVAVGDFNNDGRKDVVLATTMTQQGSNPDDQTLFVFYQAANGSLSAPMKVKYSSLDEEGNFTIGIRKQTGITAADLNHDGIDDIVVGRRPGITVFLGNNSGTLVPTRVNATTGAESGDVIATMDVDRDGNLDIVTHNETGGAARFGITVYFGDGMGGFPRQRFLATLSDGGLELKIGDLNGDGFNDIAIAWLQGLTSGVEIFPHDGVSWFGSSQYFPKPTNMINTYVLAVGDFNDDYRDDFVMSGSTRSFDAKGVYYYRQSYGQFLPPVELPAANLTDSSNIPDNAIVADINGDGKDDIVILRSGGPLGYFEQGSAGMNPEVVFPGPYATWSGNQSLAVGDIDGDGCADAVTANYNYGLVVFSGQNCLRRARGSSPLIPPAHVAGAVSASAAPSPSIRPVREAGNFNGWVRLRSMVGELRRLFAAAETWWHVLLDVGPERSATALIARPTSQAPAPASHIPMEADELQCRVTDPELRSRLKP